MCHKYLIDAVLLEARTTRGSAAMLLETEKSGRDSQIAAQELHLCAKTILNENYLALVNRAGGLYERILTEVVSTDRTQ